MPPTVLGASPIQRSRTMTQQKDDTTTVSVADLPKLACWSALSGAAQRILIARAHLAEAARAPTPAPPTAPPAPPRIVTGPAAPGTPVNALVYEDAESPDTTRT